MVRKKKSKPLSIWQRTEKFFWTSQIFRQMLCWFQLSSIVAERTLEAVGAKGMVVGHTPQMHGVNWYLFLLISIGDLI